jgi:hypothetical protein
MGDPIRFSVIRIDGFIGRARRCPSLRVGPSIWTLIAQLSRAAEPR